MENIFHADEQYFNFLKGQVRQVKAEKNQSILASVLRALTGSRQKVQDEKKVGDRQPTNTGNFGVNPCFQL